MAMTKKELELKIEKLENLLNEMEEELSHYRPKDPTEEAVELAVDTIYAMIKGFQQKGLKLDQAIALTQTLLTVGGAL